MRVIFRWLLALQLLLVVLAACAHATHQPVLTEAEDVVRRLEDDYVDQTKLDPQALNDAAIRGIIDSLDDPYTSYLSTQQYQDFTASLRGADADFEGIGAELTVRDGRVMVLGPLPDSPAVRAGIRPGDFIVAVDGVSTEGESLLEVVARVRGPKGTTVVLRLQRAGSVAPVEISVVRDTIHLTSVSRRIQAEDIGYVGLDGFNEQTAAGLREAITQLRAAGAKGLILDLRSNTGGLVDAAIAVVSEFIREGNVFLWRHADGTEEPYPVTGEGTAYDLPLVVLVNGYSASASEITAGALQDHGRAVLIGTTTYGKGSVNLLEELDSGAGLYVTTARWLTPSGHLIEGQGLEPDIAVDASGLSPALVRIGGLTADLCAAYDGELADLLDVPALTGALDELCGLGEVAPAGPEGDPQLDAAIEQLRLELGG
jgi:carboxyl-terminal processing protease